MRQTLAFVGTLVVGSVGAACSAISAGELWGDVAYGAVLVLGAVGAYLVATLVAAQVEAREDAHRRQQVWLAEQSPRGWDRIEA